MRRIAAAAVLMAACTWSVARSEDRGGPNGGPMSSKEYTVGGHDKEVVCYWGTWANYRPGNGKFTPEDIDPALCTNVIYSFAGLDSETNAIKSLGRPQALPASVVRGVAAKYSIHAVIRRIQLAPNNLRSLKLRSDCARWQSSAGVFRIFPGVVHLKVPHQGRYRKKAVP